MGYLDDYRDLFPKQTEFEVTTMSNENNDRPISDNTLSVTLTVGQLKGVLTEALATATNQHEAGEERLLDVEEAVAVLGLSTDWLYRNAKKLPFTRKLGPKMLRFSHRGILKWLATRRPAN
jgi:predicted DNA-binding transcriptional regulator AlpA